MMKRPYVVMYDIKPRCLEAKQSSPDCGEMHNTYLYGEAFGAVSVGSMKNLVWDSSLLTPGPLTLSTG